MEEQEYISILMTTYNSEKWVRRAMESVLTAADANCEIVVVDDGSTDGTVDILREYEEKDPRVLVIEIEHGGLSCARRTAYENSSGESIVFVDSDDIMHPNAIADLRAASTPDCDIVVGNVSVRNTNGTSTLLYSGHRREVSPEEFLKHILLNYQDITVLGKKFARRLLCTYEWDTDTVLEGIFHRALLLSIICAATGTVVIAPSSVVYSYIRRPNSLSAMLNLRAASLERLWMTISKLPLPRKEYVEWGLSLIDRTMLSRGLPFGKDFTPAIHLLEAAKGLDLTDEQQRIVRKLRDSKFRMREARRLVREGKLTTVSPHITFIIPVYNNFSALHKTVESIFDTGFRNIEVMIVDDGSLNGVGVKVNSYAISYPRLHLRKHTSHRGLMQARLTGLQAARGHAVMFLNPGDTIEPQGILDALTLVDGGCDIAMMGARTYGCNSEFGTDIFRPSDAPRLSESNASIFTGLLERTSLPHSICFGIGRTEFMKSIDFECTDDDALCDTLWLMNIMCHDPKLRCTDSIGYVQRRHACNKRNAEDRCRSHVALGQASLGMLKRIGRDDDTHRASVAKGVTLSITRTLTSVMRTPFFGRRRAHKLAYNIFSSVPLCHFYASAESDAPDPEECLRQAAEAL